jgi:hypothetical protein
MKIDPTLSEKTFNNDFERHFITIFEPLMNGVNKSNKEPLWKVGVGNGLVLVKVIGKETISKMQSSVIILKCNLQ